ncbi:DUF4376 domain-containing protein [Vreelandella arctica]|uniref:DUF4376 domain-containing protein n=1 Tax=Vreelandella arctica TaxID=3126499 RepID=UPI00300DE5F4|tara:strand:+ start:174 stop:857 length:684 start_codon:yes stop_codon:yes gene_type:complete
MFSVPSSNYIASGIARLYSAHYQPEPGAINVGMLYQDPANDTSLEKGYEYTAAYDQVSGFVLRYRRTVADVDTETLEILAPHGDWELHGNISKEATQRELAAVRYNRETGGVELPDGSRIRTDRESQAQVNAAYTTLRDSFLTTADFKGENGWVTITLAEITPIAKAVAQHVQPCFTAERRVSEKINAAEDAEALNAIDIAGEFAAALEAIKAEQLESAETSAATET